MTFGIVSESYSKTSHAPRASKVAISKSMQGTNWNANKCKEHLGSRPEVVLRQATINLDSRVWKSLEDSLPKLYCVDLAKAYVTQERDSSRILCENKRYDSQSPNEHLYEKPLAKGGKGKENR